MHIVNVAGNCPYFLQDFGSAIWMVATGSPFSLQNAQAAKELGRARLDSGFFPSRWERATPAEREYMKAMAVDGDGGPTKRTHRSTSGKSAQALAPSRASLISKGIICAPQRGYIALTVPGMASLIERQRQLLED